MWVLGHIYSFSGWDHQLWIGPHVLPLLDTCFYTQTTFLCWVNDLISSSTSSVGLNSDSDSGSTYCQARWNTSQGSHSKSNKKQDGKEESVGECMWKWRTTEYGGHEVQITTTKQKTQQQIIKRNKQMTKHNNHTCSAAALLLFSRWEKIQWHKPKDIHVLFTKCLKIKSLLKPKKKKKD